MSFPNFPSTICRPSYDPSNKDIFPTWSDAVIESKAKGYRSSRPSNTRIIMGHNYVWTAMPDEQYETFKTFINATICLAGEFYFTTPITNVVKLVKLTKEPTAVQGKYGSWTVNMTVEEA